MATPIGRLALPCAAPAGARRSTLRRFSRIRRRRSPGSAAATGADAGSRGEGRRRDRRRSHHHELRRGARGARRRHHFDRDAQSPARRPGRRRRPGRQALRAREADRPGRSGAGPHSRRRAAAGVRTIVSFELRYNPFLKFARWLREPTAGSARSASRARSICPASPTGTRGWDWVRTRESGRSHLLAAGCHAVDALRFCTGLEPIAVSAFHTRFTDGYEWPTSIIANMTLEGSALGHVSSSTDFMLPYTFVVELMGDRATLRQDLLQWLDYAARPRGAGRRESVSGRPPRGGDRHGGPAGDPDRLHDAGSADVSHHPFQAEIDEIVACVLEDRETSINVFDAQRRWKCAWRRIGRRSSEASRSRCR